MCGKLRRAVAGLQHSSPVQCNRGMNGTIRNQVLEKRSTVWQPACCVCLGQKFWLRFSGSAESQQGIHSSQLVHLTLLMYKYTCFSWQVKLVSARASCTCMYICLSILWHIALLHHIHSPTSVQKYCDKSDHVLIIHTHVHVRAWWSMIYILDLFTSNATLWCRAWDTPPTGYLFTYSVTFAYLYWILVAIKSLLNCLSLCAQLICNILHIYAIYIYLYYFLYNIYITSLAVVPWWWLLFRS